MELPSDILQIIKEYAQPLTRPNWRHLHRLTSENLYKYLLPYHINRYKIDDGIMHLICIRNIQLMLLVNNKDMWITMIERTV
jgi:hypothetical protein